MTKLLPFQNAGVRAIYHLHGRALLADEQGLGKTIQALSWIRRLPKRRPVIVVCPSSVKYSWKEEARQHFGIRVDVLEGRATKRSKLPGDFVIINYDILPSWLKILKRAKPQIVILDECFLEDALVTTSWGPLPIKEIVEKKLPVRVMSRSEAGKFEWKPVVHYIKIARRRNLVKVTHEQGELICTENHKVWINGDYIEARHLRPGQILQMVPKEHCSQASPKNAILQPAMCLRLESTHTGCEGKNLQQSREIQVDFREQTWEEKPRSVQMVEGEQPNAQRRTAIEAKADARKEWHTACLDRQTRGEWESVCPAGNLTQGLGERMGGRSGDPFRWAAEKGNGDLLQSRHRSPTSQDWNRSGWGQPQSKAIKKVGCQEDQNSRIIRVENFEISKQTSDEQLGTGDAPGAFVYCLEVKDNHNFFADGVLVSNCHYIVNPAAKRSRAVHKLCASVASVVGLSGTPMTNRPIELWSVLKAINPTIFPSRQGYAWTYCQPRWTPWGWRFDGSTNAKQLNRILRKRVMIRRLKKEVAKDLPPIQSCTVPFKLKPKSLEDYEKATNDFIKWLQEQSPSKAQKAQKAEALVKVGYLIRLAARLKLEWTEQWIRDFLDANPGKKLVGLTMHRFVIDHLRERFRGRVLFIDGRVKGLRRHQTVRAFQTDKRHDLLIGNWKAAGVGITLTRASDIAALDFPWTAADLKQGRDRIHRIGQKEPCTLYHLVALKTIELKQIRLLWKKNQMSDAVLDGTAAGTDTTILNALLKEITKRTK